MPCSFCACAGYQLKVALYQFILNHKSQSRVQGIAVAARRTAISGDLKPRDSHARLAPQPTML
jgi:hypothetical protein